VVRVSGPDALIIAGTLLRKPAALEAQPSHTVRRVQLVDGDSGNLIDDAVCTVMRGPRSYTGEDVVELSCHGSPPLLAMVVEGLRRAGARLAAPGEFTRRAFVNGRLDLGQAEAVALMIGARTERSVKLAARARLGDLGDRVTALREALLELVGGLEVSLDFPDERVGIDVDAARERVQELAHEVDGIVVAAQRGRFVQDGVTIAIVGRPNAGKSSLLNALLGRDQAIVAPTPGTTRDVVEGALVIGGVPARLLDTAGLAHPVDAIEAEGMRRSRRALDESDIALLVVDGSTAPAPNEASADLTGRRVIVVRSKSDLPQNSEANEPRDAIAVSAMTGGGLSVLLRRIGEEIVELVGAENEEGQIATSLRQREGLERLQRALRSVTTALAGMPLEVALVDFRQALLAASALLGVELGDAVLDRIFSTFCVGK
jgi:tRNA modification GTPase